MKSGAASLYIREAVSDKQSTLKESVYKDSMYKESVFRASPTKEAPYFNKYLSEREQFYKNSINSATKEELGSKSYGEMHKAEFDFQKSKQSYEEVKHSNHEKQVSTDYCKTCQSPIRKSKYSYDGDQNIEQKE